LNISDPLITYGIIFNSLSLKGNPARRS